jgi:magnesium chelatase family protein
MEAALVTVEVHLANGLPNFTIVGLPETEVKESKDRVRAALQNCRFDFPARRITVNLAPADLPKESGRFDLPIALGILAATGQIPSAKLADYEYAGELALTGELRAIRGALAMTYHAASSGRAFILPQANAAEAALVEGTVYPANRCCRWPHISPDAQPSRRAPKPSRRTTGYARSQRAGAGQARVGNCCAGGTACDGRPPGTGNPCWRRASPLLPQMSEAEALSAALRRWMAASMW